MSEIAMLRQLTMRLLDAPHMFGCNIAKSRAAPGLSLPFARSPG
jgi:hypothetical protein